LWEVETVTGAVVTLIRPDDFATGVSSGVFGVATASGTARAGTFWMIDDDITVGSAHEWIYMSFLTDGVVDTDQLADDAVTNAKIADDAVDTAQIADDAVDTAQIADDAVDTAQIADDAVTADKIADRAVIGPPWLVTRIDHTATFVVSTKQSQVILANAAGGAVVVTLPAITADWDGVVVLVKARDATGGITINANAADDIDGAASKTISTTYASFTLIASYDAGGASYWSVA